MCHKSLERSREFRESQSLLYTRLKPLSPSKSSPTRSKTTGSVPGHSGRSQAAEALATRAGIDSFEAGLSLRSARMETRPHSTGSMGEGTAVIKVECVCVLLLLFPTDVLLFLYPVVKVTSV